MTDLKGIKGFTVQTFANDTAGTLAETGTWSSGATAPQTTQSGGSFGITTAAVSTGGYDGSSWTELNDLGTARASLGGAGTSGAAIGFGGNTPTRTAATEEFTLPAFGIKTVTTS